MKPTNLTKLQPKKSERENIASTAPRSLSASYCSFKPSGSEKIAGYKSAAGFKADDFLKVSADYLEVENRRTYLAEVSLFTLLVVLSAWPIVLMIQAIARWI